jgi:hypothetical protein
MKTTTKFTLLATTLGFSAWMVVANAQDAQRPQRPNPDRPEGRRPMMPLIRALDTNQDGEISADEISKAAESLKTLDKNSDGKLTREEYMPPRPPGGPGGPGRPDGARPDGERRPQRPQGQ